ncbi:MAG: CoA transferase [Acidobacteria bacterium]|nr:CoA transferase [Acidobacteriota bacterium]
MNNNTVRPLQGIRVIGFEQQVAGPYCTMMLAHQGADVIKIERPGIGDSSREMAPIVKNSKGESNSGYFLRFNLNKRSMTLDITVPAGREIFKELAAISDVVVENSRPGTMKKYGVDYEALKKINPRLIYAAISGFGTMPQYQGEYSERPAYDIISQAMGGLMHTCGFEDRPPSWLGIALGDIYSGVMAAYGVTLALIQREKTGEGQYLDISMYDNMASLSERYLTAYSLTGTVMRRGREKFIAPWGAFPCKDGYVALIIATERDWAKFCETIGRPDLIKDPCCVSGPVRAENMDHYIGPIIEKWMSDKTKEAICSAFLANGLPAGPVQDASEVFNCRHLSQRDLLVETDDPILGKIKLVGSPLKLSGSPGQLNRPVPLLGQHTDEVLNSVLGYSSDRIAALRKEKVI